MANSDQETEQAIHAELRAAIDRDDREAISRIKDENPDLRWNAITPNGLSALWWALTPPEGKPINEELVEFLLRLETNNYLLIDPSQTYAGLRPDYYCRSYLPVSSALNNKIAKYQNTYVRQQQATPQNDQQQQQQQGVALAMAAHGASDAFATTTANDNLNRLYARYGDSLDVEAEIKDIYNYLKSDAFIQQFPKLKTQRDYIYAALKRSESDPAPGEPRTETPNINTLKDTLALVWRAAKESQAERLPPNTRATVLDRKNRVIEELLEAQSAYKNINNPSCWRGTWNRTGNALAEMHKDVYFPKKELTTQETFNAFAAIIGEELTKVQTNDPALFGAILRRALLTYDEDNAKATAKYQDKDAIKKYDDWLSSLTHIKSLLIESGAKPGDVDYVISEAQTGAIPLSLNKQAAQFIGMQEFYTTKKESEFFLDSLLNLKQQSPNEVLAQLKDRYIDTHIHAPANMADRPDIRALKASVLEKLLTHRSDDEVLKEADLWKAAISQLAINELKDQNISSWCSQLPFESQLLLSEYVMNIGRQLTPQDILKFALHNGQLTGLALSGHDLRGIDFRGYDLRGVDFSKTKLQGCNFGLMTAEGAKWDGCDLTDATFNQFVFPEALLGSVSCSEKSLALQNNDGNTVLLDANARNDHDMVKKILASEHCTDRVLLRSNRRGDTLLHEADNSDIIKAIFASKGYTPQLLKSKNNDNSSPIVNALFNMRHNSNIASTIFNLSPPMTDDEQAEKMNFGRTILIVLAGNCTDPEVIKTIINAPSFNAERLTDRDDNGLTPILSAFYNENPEILQTILASTHCTENALSESAKKPFSLMETVIRTNNPPYLQTLLNSEKCSPGLLMKENWGIDGTVLHNEIKESLDESYFEDEDSHKSRDYAKILLTCRQCTSEFLAVQNRDGETVIDIIPNRQRMVSIDSIKDAVKPYLGADSSPEQDKFCRFVTFYLYLSNIHDEPAQAFCEALPALMQGNQSLLFSNKDFQDFFDKMLKFAGQGEAFSAPEHTGPYRTNESRMADLKEMADAMLGNNMLDPMLHHEINQSITLTLLQKTSGLKSASAATMHHNPQQQQQPLQPRQLDIKVDDANKTIIDRKRGG